MFSISSFSLYLSGAKRKIKGRSFKTKRGKIVDTQELRHLLSFFLFFFYF